MQQLTKMSDYLRDSGDLLHGAKRSCIYWLLCIAFVKLDMFTVNKCYLLSKMLCK